MAVNNYCSLNSPSVLEAVQTKIFESIMEAGMHPSRDLSRLSFSNSLKELVKQNESENKDELISVIHDFLESSGELAYSQIGGNWSLEDIEAAVKGRKGVVNDSDENPNKTDELDEPKEQSTSSFIDSVYGTSTAKDKLLKSVRRKFLNLFFISVSTDQAPSAEINDMETVNQNIKNYQNELFDVVKSYYKSIVNNPEFDSLELYDKNGNYTGALKTLNQFLDPYKYDYTIDKLQELSSSTFLRSKLKFKALNALFMLNNFDRMLQLLLKKSIEFNKGEFGTYTGNLNKYRINLRNHQITTTWRDDDKDIDAVAEANALIQLLFESIPEYDSSDVYLSYRGISSTNAKVRQLMHHPAANQSLYELSGNTLSEEFLEELAHYVGRNSYADVTLRDVVVKSFTDQIEGPRHLYEVLSMAEDWSKDSRHPLGLHSQDFRVIKSLFNGVFDSANPDSFYSIYSDSLRYDDSVYNPRKGYYKYLTQNLGTQESIDAQQYSRTDYTMSNRTLKDSGDSAKTYSIDQRLGGILNVELDPKFIHFEYVSDGLSDAKQPHIEIKVGDYAIKKYGKKSALEIRDGNGKVLNDTGLNSSFDRFTSFIKEITGFDVTNTDFITELQKRHPNYQQDLLKFVSNILYNYAVSKHLREDEDIVMPNGMTRQEAFKKALSTYYTEDAIPAINSNVKGGQLSYTNNSDTPIKLALVRTHNAINNVVDDSIVKDASGSAIASVGLDQLATKYIAQLHRVSRKNPALSKFIIHNLYRGQEFARDFKSQNGTVKVATAMSEAEHFIGNFVYDFMNQIYDSQGNLQVDKVIKLMPTVISDKSRIMKTLFDLREPSTILDEKGIPVPYYKLSVSQWQELTKQQLGEYYQQTYLQNKQVFDRVTNFLSGLVFNQSELPNSLKILKNYMTNNNATVKLDLDTNFAEFSEIVTVIANDKNVAEGYYRKPDALIKDIFHDVVENMQSRGEKIEITSIIGYNISKKEIKDDTGKVIAVQGFLQGNTLLMDQLYRWGILKDGDTAVTAYKLKEAYEKGEGYGTADQFFEKKKMQYVGDLLKDNCEIRLNDNLFNEFKDGAFKRFRKNKWTDGENVVFAKIQYEFYDGKSAKEGKPIQRTLNITDKDSLRNSYIYREVYRNAMKYANYASVRDFIDVDSPKFNIGKFIEAIDIFNRDTAFYKQLQDIRNQITTQLKEQGFDDVKIEEIFKEENLKNLIAGDTKLKVEDAKLQKALNKILASVDMKNDANVLREATSTLSSPQFIMNPDLELYQSIDYLLSQEYVVSSVGTHINHPDKGGKTLIERESASWGQQVKRNVSMTASKHKFITNSLDGIRSQYNIAVVEDDSDLVFSVTGKKGKVKPFDGATFCNGTTNYLENNSLEGDRAGIDKKQFIHDYNPITGTGIIVKTAGFAVTNERIRMSEFMGLINKKMNTVIHEVDGQPVRVDITKDYNGNSLVQRYGNIAYEQDGKIYRVRNIIFDESTGKTTVSRLVLTKNGWELAKSLELDITTNYDIWKNVFGGEYCVEFNIDDIENATLDTEYEYSETSWHQMTYATNRVGYIKNDPVTGQPYVNPTTNDQVDQILKRSMIDYIVTEGAIKQGAANVNTRQAYFDPNYKLTTMRLSMHDAGIQLDAEHHADDSTLSLMTQVLNALGARGYSSEIADEVYEALKGLAREALKDFDWSDTEIKNADTPEMQEFLADITVRAIRTTSSTDGNLINALSRTIQDEYDKGNKVTYDLIRENMPMSNSGTFGKMVSQFASLLTKQCVRIKFPGSMDVLVPSNRIYKLYNGRLLSHYKGVLTGIKEYGENLPSVTDIQLGRTYKIITESGIQVDINGLPTTEDILIEDPNDYWKLKDLAAKQKLFIKENFRVGRDLASYNVRIQVAGDSTTYNIWDLDAVKDCYTIDNKVKKLLKDLENPEANVVEIQQELSEIATKIGYKSDVIDADEIHKVVMRNLQNALTNLSKGSEVMINNQPKKIISSEVQPYELIMSKIYETTFGLKTGDDVADITNNPAFFIERSLQNITSNINEANFDIELKKVNGRHVYLIDSASRIPSNLQKIDIEIRQEGGEVFRVDESGQRMYSLSSENDQIYTDENGNEIIVTDNMQYYVERTKFTNISLSERLAKEDNLRNLATILNKLTAVDKSSVTNMLKWLEFEELVKLSQTDPDAFMDKVDFIQTKLKNSRQQYLKESKDLLKDLKKAKISGDYSFLDKKYKNTLIRTTINSGREIHTSFLKSLNVLAARIPAQSHQSFMAMKVVGFEGAGKNSAYVNRMQIWLQGSDYDIDKVSLLGYKFNSGNLVKWSPFMNLTSYAHLRASETLPFPTGKTLGFGEHDQEFFDLMNQLNVDEENSPQYIKTLAKLIKRANKLGYVPVGATGYGSMQEIINKHNNYFAKNNNRKHALINFISTNMYNTSADPINLIQGQQPIDDATDAVKDEAKDKPMGIRSKEFAPGSPQSKLAQLILTLTGKENTGIVASAMKNFEACSQYFYKVLNEGTPEQQERLLIGKKIFGKNIKLLANSFANNIDTVTNEAVRSALATVNNDEDAFILFSALLSLSTDNAKDPTLAKINAGPKLMSLYTAGLMVGFNINDLIGIMTSDFGWVINDLLQSNVFNDSVGQFSIDGVYDWLAKGPVKEFKALPKEVKKDLHKWAIAYRNKQAILRGEDITEFKKELTDTEVVMYLKSPSLKLENLIARQGKSKDIIDEVDKRASQEHKSKMSAINAQLKKLLKVKTPTEEQLIEIKALQLLKDSNLNPAVPDPSKYAQMVDYRTDAQAFEKAQEMLPIFEEATQQEMEILDDNIWDAVDEGSYQEKSKQRLKRFIKALRKYHHIQKIAKKSKITNDQGEQFLAKDVIRQLNLIANEQSRLRPVLGLNQGLPNDVQSQLKFLRNFESIFTQRIAEMKGGVSRITDDSGEEFVERLKAVTGREDTRISFDKFVTNEQYRNDIIQLYDEIKTAVNVFDVMVSVPHYFGYLEAMYALTRSAGLSSKVYQETNNISRDILSKYMDVAKSSSTHAKMVKRIVKFINNKLNNQFLLASNVVLTVPSGIIYDKYGNEMEANNTEIVLGTPSGNASFKRWMEETVIPELKTDYQFNDFIQKLMMVSSNLSWDGMSSLNMSLNINMMPKSDSERAEFKKYKDSLNNLRKREYGEHRLIDLMFYYNLIAYNGESSQNSFTSLFEDIFAEKGNNAVTDWIKFYSIFDKEGSFELGVDYTEDELLRFIATKENPESAKMPYIRVYNPNTMAIELVKKINNDTNYDEEGEPDYLQDAIGQEIEGFDSESSGGQGMSIEERLFNSGYAFVNDGVQDYPRYFTNGYVEQSDRVALSGNQSIVDGMSIQVKGVLYKEADIKQLAQKNGHGDVSLEDIIVKVKTKDGERINTHLTKYNLDRLFEENTCK